MSLHFLYETKPGRLILKLLTKPSLSVLCGKFLDTKASKIFISPFIKNNDIDMSEYQEEEYHCFNDCFSRRIRPECRPLNLDSKVLMSPCDGLLSVYKISEGLVIPVKQSSYSISDLLKNRELAAEFDGGYCLVFRLCVNHYHRYVYPDNGTKGENIFIPGVLHTVRPIALRNEPVFIENSREYTTLETENIGRIIQMEVGAMLVGKIANNHGTYSFNRGEEKGKFLYGGSTIILLIKNNTISIQETTEEIPVKLGQRIADIN